MSVQKALNCITSITILQKNAKEYAEYQGILVQARVIVCSCNIVIILNLPLAPRSYESGSDLQAFKCLTTSLFLPSTIQFIVPSSKAP